MKIYPYLHLFSENLLHKVIIIRSDITDYTITCLNCKHKYIKAYIMTGSYNYLSYQCQRCYSSNHNLVSPNDKAYHPTLSKYNIYLPDTIIL